ncbi:MAG: hypothetical protein Q9224_003357 [Gallowayella concinna]
MFHYDSHNINVHDHSLQPQDGNRLSWESLQSIEHGIRPSTFTSPMTPSRAVPNTGKKRKALDLSRSTPAHSHHSSMSAIFEDASRTLKTMPSPRLLSANARKVRMPLSTTKSVRNIVTACTLADESMPDRESRERENTAPHDGSILGSPTPLRPKSLLATGARRPKPTIETSSDIPSQVKCPSGEHPGTEPISSGFNSPAGKVNHREVVYPNLTRLLSSPAHRPPASDTEQKLPGGDSRSPIPAIETWLDQIFDDRRASTIEELDSRQARSHKGVSPSRIPVARQDLCPLSPCDPTRVPHPLTPRPGFNSPPKRKILRLSPTKDGSPTTLNNQDFDIYEDESSEEMVNLSPIVEKYRKGRGPKRERCVSYWDEDILPELRDKPAASERVNAVREPLRELPSLTTAKGFVDGIENATFDFKVGVEGSDP